MSRHTILVQNGTSTEKGFTSGTAGRWGQYFSGSIQSIVTTPPPKFTGRVLKSTPNGTSTPGFVLVATGIPPSSTARTITAEISLRGTRGTIPPTRTLVVTCVISEGWTATHREPITILARTDLHITSTGWTTSSATFTSSFPRTLTTACLSMIVGFTGGRSGPFYLSNPTFFYTASTSPTPTITVPPVPTLFVPNKDVLSPTGYGTDMRMIENWVKQMQTWASRITVT